MNDLTWLDYMSAIGSVATPILVLGLAGIGWRLRSRLERQFALEDKLREDRIGTYNQILEPFIILLTSDAAWKSDPKHKNLDKNQTAVRKMLSVDYRAQGFRLSLVGSDAVVKAYNDLMQYFFQRDEESTPAGETEIREMMSLLGQFLLEIRRSMGNEGTQLKGWDMLEWFISDARRLRS